MVDNLDINYTGKHVLFDLIKLIRLHSIYMFKKKKRRGRRGKKMITITTKRNTSFSSILTKNFVYNLFLKDDQY
jgi:hypothetical protein